MQFENEDQYRLFEDQDMLIVQGITMLSQRLNDFYALMKQHGLDLPTPFRKTQQAWLVEYKRMHHKLTNWEIGNLGK